MITPQVQKKIISATEELNTLMGIQKILVEYLRTKKKKYTRFFILVSFQEYIKALFK